MHTPAWQAGLRGGDTILAINGEQVLDDLDIQFLTADWFLEFDILRRGVRMQLACEREPGTFLGIEPVALPIRRCRNKCIFCFIDQMPRGLRKSLYIKDEDLLHSFINGNYVTLASATTEDLRRITSRGISPIYVSVHATDQKVRSVMLGNRRLPDVKEQLSFLARKGGAFHTQIVVCPGYNDGAVLKKTVQDLLRFQKALCSIAVVPVGLTRFRSFPLEPVSAGKAQEILDMLMPVAERDRQRTGRRRVYLADELFLKVGKPVPSRSYYEDYPQIENGIGLIRQFLQDQKSALRMLASPKRSVTRIGSGGKVLLVTAVSAGKVLAAFAQKANFILETDIFSVVSVENHFFGSSVTVAGLLTARDVLRAISMTSPTYRTVVVPSVMFNYRGFTLDGYSRERMERQCGCRLIDAHNARDILEKIGIVQ